MLKKVFTILITLLFLCSCSRDYKCVIKYQVTYPDTSWVNTYTFDGQSRAKPHLYVSSTGAKKLSVYPYNELTYGEEEITAVPNADSDIIILDFKMYRYGVDIPKKEK